MGVHVDVQKLPVGFDAYAICTGTPTARDLSIPGRELKGIYLSLIHIYIIRKRIENRIRKSDIPTREDFYIVSLSTKNIVYKGMLSSL